MTDFIRETAEDIRAALPKPADAQIAIGEDFAFVITDTKVFEIFYSGGLSVYVTVSERRNIEAVGDDTMWYATIPGESNPHFTDEALEQYRIGDEAEYQPFDVGAAVNANLDAMARSITDVWNANKETSTGVEPGQYGWIDFAHMESDENPERFYIEIFSTDENGEYGEEVAVICHRLVGGRFPLDGDVANSKRERAQHIVDTLNASRVSA